MVDPIIDKLPEVENCCFCIPLKLGTIIVVIISLLLCGGVFVPGLVSSCITESSVGDIAGYVSYALWVINIILAIACIVFLIGICLDKAITARIYLYAGLLFLLFYIIASVLTIVAKVTSKGCKFPLADLIMAGITVACWLYFFIVAKSYATQQMSE